MPVADRGLVLEDRLQDALAHLGLVRRVGGQELAALEHCVDDRRDIVVVDPRAEERELRPRVHVLGGELLEVRDELLLGESGLDLEVAAEADASGMSRKSSSIEETRSPRASPRGLVRSVRESWLTARRRRPVGRGVHQLVDLGGVLRLDADEPALAVRVGVDGLGLFDDSG